jgi:hypothetical protein
VTLSRVSGLASVLILSICLDVMLFDLIHVI